MRVAAISALGLLAACGSNVVGGGGGGATVGASAASTTASAGAGGAAGVGGAGSADAGSAGVGGWGAAGAGGSSTSTGTAGGTGGGAPCNVAECAEGVTIVPGLYWPWGLALDGSTLYWSDWGHVGWVPPAGGPPTVLWEPMGLFNRLVVDGASLFVAGTEAGHVGKGPLGGGMLQWLAFAGASVQIGQPIDLVVDDDNVYWTDDVYNVVNAVPKDGGPVTTIGGGSNPRDMVLAGKLLFWANDDGTLVLRDLLAGTSVVFVSEPGSLFGVAADADYVYWTNVVAGTLSRAPLVGGPTTVLARGLSGPARLLVQDGFAYWQEFGNSAVWRLPSDGAGVPVRVTPYEWNSTAVDFATDAQYIYYTWWNDVPGGADEVRRVPLCCVQ